MLRHSAIRVGSFCFAVVVVCSSCKRESTPITPVPEAVSSQTNILLRVGDVLVTNDDLKHRLQEKHGGSHDAGVRQAAMQALARRAQFVQAARDANLVNDPVVREELGRLLEARYRATYLAPKLDAAQDVPESRLLELYDAEIDRFQTPEKRRVAVLWLNPGADPERGKAYIEKLQHAHDWLLEQANLVADPSLGFSVLSVDHSQHAATRFKGGVLGWVMRDGNVDAWRQVVADIAFALETPGALSSVVTNAQGMFLVRLIERQAPVQRSFASVRAQLDKDERHRLRGEMEQKLLSELNDRYPVQWNTDATLR